MLLAFYIFTFGAWLFDLCVQGRIYTARYPWFFLLFGEMNKAFEKKSLNLHWNPFNL